MPLVSVLMPVFNRQTIVGDAIRSILQQTFQDWELIILDDASTDKTLEVCRSFASADPRITVHSNEQNLGVGKTRMKLNSLASGKYIAIQDSDDISVPERLAKQVQVLESKPEVGVISGIAAFLDDTGEVFRYFPELLHRGGQYPQNKQDMVRLLYHSCEIANPAILFRRMILEKIRDPYGEYQTIDDWHFFLQAAHAERFWGIPEVLVKMRRGQGHAHLWDNYGLALKEVCRMMESVYNRYKGDPESPINFALYRTSLSPWLNKHGRYFGGWRGYLNILQAVAYDPSNQFARESLKEFSGRAIRKAKRFAIRSKKTEAAADSR
jgi:glycosyltransferase involved in cell wall biosynthesis